MRQYVEQTWLPYITTQVSGKTYERYSEIARLRIVLAFGSRLLVDLKARDIQAQYSRWLAATGGRKRETLSAQTVHHYHRVLYSILRYAEQHGAVGRNVCVTVKPPKIEGAEINALEEDGALRLIAAAKAYPRLEIPVFLAVYTGLRRGELLGLRWSAIDLDLRRLQVTQALE